MRRLLRKGDPCPCCGSPIPTDDEATLGLLTVLAERMGLPLPRQSPGVSKAVKPE